MHTCVFPPSYVKVKTEESHETEMTWNDSGIGWMKFPHFLTLKETFLCKSYFLKTEVTSNWKNSDTLFCAHMLWKDLTQWSVQIFQCEFTSPFILPPPFGLDLWALPSFSCFHSTCWNNEARITQKLSDVSCAEQHASYINPSLRGYKGNVSARVSKRLHV